VNPVVLHSGASLVVLDTIGVTFNGTD